MPAGMTAPDDLARAPLTDPASVLLGLGAVAGLIAATYWLRVFRSVDTSGQVVTGPRNSDLKSAALFTAAALFLSCGGFLLGRLTGRL